MRQRSALYVCGEGEAWVWAGTTLRDSCNQVLVGMRLVVSLPHSGPAETYANPVRH